MVCGASLWENWERISNGLGKKKSGHNILHFLPTKREQCGISALFLLAINSLPPQQAGEKACAPGKIISHRDGKILCNIRYKSRSYRGSRNI